MPVCPPVSFGPGGFFIGVDMEEKVYKTYRQLLTKLRSRGMIIGKGSQGSRVMRILEQENYYNVINGYKDLFLQTLATPTSDEKYKTGTTFDEVYALYQFDREIRNIHIKYLLKIENSFKTVISHEFSKKYGHDNYLKLENFQSGASTDPQELNKIARANHLQLPKDLAKVQRLSAENNAGNVIKLIGDIQQEIARQMGKHHQVVTHYMTQHGYIPLWVLVNVLTFGKITSFYFNMKPADRAPIARYFGVQEKELHKYMNLLSMARNKCAHDERFFDIRFRTNLHTKSIRNFSVLNLPRDASGTYTKGINDAYAVAIMFSQLLSKTDLHEFVNAMNTQFKKLAKSLNVISVEDVMDVMGYTKDWPNILQLLSLLIKI